MNTSSIPVIPFQLLQVSLPHPCRHRRHIRMSVLNLQSVSRGAASAVKSFSTPICGDRVAKANQGVSLKRHQCQLRRTCNEEFVLKVTNHTSRRVAARANATRTVVSMAAGGSKKILMLGGTRFIGVYLARQLVEAGHEVTLLTRGKKPVTFQIPDDSDDSFEKYKSAVKHIACDRTDGEALKQQLSGAGFQVVYDMNGREAKDVEPVLAAVGDIEQYIFCSSAGVYLKSDQMPHREEDATDPKSRHKGKLDTEKLLTDKGINFTSVRPVYIYGPLNYNPVEEWFFHRIKAGRPIPVPNSGQQVTQLGHVKDLATAFHKILGNSKAQNQIYNISGARFVTFDGIAKACAKAAGAPEPELIHYNPKEFDFGGKKAFPLRDQHFFASIDKAMADLDWAPEFSLVEGLTDSYQKDFGRGTFRKEADFATDDMVLEKVKSKQPALA